MQGKDACDDGLFSCSALMPAHVSGLIRDRIYLYVVGLQPDTRARPDVPVRIQKLPGYLD